MINNLTGTPLILCGLVIFAAAYFEWNWFINFYRVKRVYDLLGNKAAKRFYYVLALFFLFAGIWMMAD